LQCFLQFMELTQEKVNLIIEQDRRTILELYHATFNLLMSAAVRYKNNQEDQMTLVNNAFLKIVTNIQHYKIGSAYFSWAKRIIQNEIIDDFRKNKKYKELFNFESDETASNEISHSEIDAQIEAEQLQLMLNNLPPATRLVFNLYAIDGFESKEICEQLDLSYETVKWHIKEARKKLRILINQTNNQIATIH
jgi:RNA polymerase sigma factor (sigma-70 family)